MSDQQTPTRRSTRSSAASSPAVSGVSNGQQNGTTPRSARGSAPTTPTGMRTPRRGNANNHVETGDEDMDVDGVSETGGRQMAHPPSATRSTRSAVSARSNGSSLVRNAQQNAGSRRRINIRGDDERSMVSGVAPFSPSGSAVSSLGLGSLSPASRNMSSPRNPRGGSDILRSPLNYGTPSSISTPRTSGLGLATPIRQRSDIGSDRNVRHINVQPTTGEEGLQLVIWGTDVSASEFKEKFKRFIRLYKEENAEEDEATMETFEADQPYYMQKLEEINLLDEPYLNLNCAHLQHYDEDMYRQLLSYPQEVIPTMDTTLNEIFSEKYPDAALTHQIQVRPYNAEKTKTMRYLNPEDIDQLVTVHGMVIRSSNLMPEMREGFFKCSVCEHGATAEIDRGKILEPVLCPSCNTNFSFALIHNRSTFVDKQLIRLQEDLEDTPVGETPYMATLFAHGEMVNLVQPGDRIAVTGIYRAAPFRLNPRLRMVRAVYKTHIDVVHYRKVDSKRLREDQDGKGLHISPERIEFIQDLSKKDDVYERLARAIAPSIYEHEDVKKGLLLQLFGGTKKEFVNTGRGRFRAEINILLCGDPGTSKSQLLKYVYDLIPRSQYTSGKGSSAVGLTAYITKDPETKQIVLQTGALVLADNGVCCIDEFDKMNESTRSVLHEVMEQQTLSIAKAGIICQLNARTSVLAAANPVESQWNKNKNIIENVHLPHTLLSRFDLIFLLLDPQNDTYDRRLARHMISLYFKSPEDADADLLDMSILRDYIAYAKEYIHPKLSDEASQRLIQAYVEMRKVGSGQGQITAYPRQLESLIRLSEAHAKIRLAEIVEVADVEEAFRLHREAVKQSATDPLSGKIDVSILATGVSSAVRKRRMEMANVVKRILESKGKVSTVTQAKLLLELKENSAVMITTDMFEDVLKELQDEGLIVIAGKNVRLCHT